MVIRIKEDYDVRCNLTQFVLKYIYAYVLTFTTSTQIVTFKGLLFPFSFFSSDPCPSAFVHLSPLATHVPSLISSDLYLLVIVLHTLAHSPVMPCVASPISSDLYLLVIVLHALAHSPVMPCVPSPISSDLYLLVIVPYAVAQSPVMPYEPCIAASSMQRGLVPY